MASIPTTTSPTLSRRSLRVLPPTTVTPRRISSRCLVARLGALRAVAPMTRTTRAPTTSTVVIASPDHPPRGLTRPLWGEAAGVHGGTGQWGCPLGAEDA